MNASIQKETSHSNSSGFDAASIRADFPILQQQVNGHPLI